MKKIYARQVPPEYQESPLFWGIDINAEIFGNRRFQSITSKLFDELPSMIEDLSCVWDNIQNGYYKDDNWADELRDVVPPRGRGDYTREERKIKWVDLLRRYGGGDNCTPRFWCDALELITGIGWNHCTLRGSCQGDWQYCIYPADDWNGNSLERLEAEYFNTGTEWIVHDGETPPNGAEDIDGYSVYCVGWNDNLIRMEIADADGENVPIENVILYKFDGYIQTPKYREAQV